MVTESYRNRTSADAAQHQFNPFCAAVHLSYPAHDTVKRLVPMRLSSARPETARGSPARSSGLVLLAIFRLGGNPAMTVTLPVIPPAASVSTPTIPLSSP